MKYSEILGYKKIIKNIIMVACYFIIIGGAYALSYFTKNIILFFIGILIGGIIFYPLEIQLEKEIKEMEIMLKLDKFLDKQNK